MLYVAYKLSGAAKRWWISRRTARIGTGRCPDYSDEVQDGIFELVFSTFDEGYQIMGIHYFSPRINDSGGIHS